MQTKFISRSLSSISLSVALAMSVIPAAHAEDLVLQVTKAGNTNPNQVAIVPFLGNQTLSDLTLTHLNNTELKSSDNNLPNHPQNAEDVINNIHAWRNTGYRYVVIGSSHTILGDKTATNFDIVDLSSPKLIGARQTHIFGTSSQELQAAAVAISNKIYAAITGTTNDLVGKIAYVEETGKANQKTSTLKVMDVATQNVKNIENVNGSILTPAFSPDGTKLAYTILRQDELPLIYIQELSSDQKTLVTPFKGSNLSPAFSADGNALLFSGSHDNNNPNIYRLDLLANRLSTITQLDGAENSPSYLPNGQIIFTADNGTRSQTIYRLNNNTPIRITAGGSPRVSHDGTRLAYTQGSNLIVANVNGTNPKTIAKIGTEGMASFSPNGTSIVYSTHIGNDSKLIIKQLNTGREIILPTTGIIKDPTWSAR